MIILVINDIHVFRIFIKFNVIFLQSFMHKRLYIIIVTYLVTLVKWRILRNGYFSFISSLLGSLFFVSTFGIVILNTPLSYVAELSSVFTGSSKEIVR